MCGIAVAVDWPEASGVVARLMAGIVRRGDVDDPIGSPAPNTAMGTRRLRIVDRDHAMQPQISFDGQLWLSFNGEIYNYEELRAELIGMGVPFKTESDTEVLVNALRVWGPKALARISGMYAFVAYEPGTGQFLAARDPFGIKPLYVIQNGKGFLFCSEMRPLLSTVEAGDVLVLPPGHLLTRNICTRFDTLLTAPSQPFEAADRDTLDRLMADAVESHLPTDLPFAVMFSGGIDSTLVAHYARQVQSNVPGYFVGGPDSTDYPFAMAYAETTGFNLKVIPFDPQSDDVFNALSEAVVACESFEPSLVRGAVCSMKLSEAIHKDGFKVAICGEGADELFCGYTPLEKAFSLDAGYGRALREEILGLMNRVSLQRVDRCSMHHAIETRVPFLDPSLANYARGLEANDLVRPTANGMVGKAALRDLFDLYPQDLPRIIRDRSKILFSEGAGLKTKSDEFAWDDRFEDAISDLDFVDGLKQYAGFNIHSKEELFYLRLLGQKMDVFRVPQLRSRPAITVRPPAAAQTA
ncbi:MAG: asparagine synthetase B [Rhizomicrobium sp.]|nr:asparagine synthetase B [Rhizomicrobium sp.]